MNVNTIIDNTLEEHNIEQSDQEPTVSDIVTALTNMSEENYRNRKEQELKKSQPLSERVVFREQLTKLLTAIDTSWIDQKLLSFLQFRSTHNDLFDPKDGIQKAVRNLSNLRNLKEHTS